MRMYLRGRIWWADLRPEGLGQKTTGCSDEQRGRSKALQLIAEHQYGPKTDNTLAELFYMAWETHYSRMKDHRKCASLFRKIQEVLDCTILVQDLKTQHLMTVVATMQAQSLTGATINRYLAVISKSLKLAVMQGWIDSTPMIPFQQEGAHRVRVVTEEELQAMNIALPMTYSHLMWFMVDTGLRLGEAMNIDNETRRDAIDTGILTVRSSKTAAGLRRLPLTVRAKAKLARHLWSNSSLRAAQAAWSRARAVLGLSNDTEFVLHALRHTCASRLLAKGTPLTTIQGWLGHSSVSVTQRYAHLDMSALHTAADTLGSYVEPGRV